MSPFIVQFVDLLTNVLAVAIIIRSVLSWLPVSPSNPISTVVFQITEPLLAPLRRILPRVGLFDLSPIIAILLLFLIQNLVHRL